MNKHKIGEGGFTIDAFTRIPIYNRSGLRHKCHENLVASAFSYQDRLRRFVEHYEGLQTHEQLRARSREELEYYILNLRVFAKHGMFNTLVNKQKD